MKIFGYMQGKFQLFVILYILFLLSGCGYSSPYSKTTDYDYDQDGQVSIYLEMWDNKTNLMGYQATIQQALTNWLKKSPRYILTQNRDQSDFILSGTILSVDIPGLSYGEFDHATEVRVKTRLSYQLVDTRTKKVVLKKMGILKQQTASIGNDSVQTSSNQQQALAILADSVADEIYIQLFYLFTRNDMTQERQIVPTNDIKILE